MCGGGGGEGLHVWGAFMCGGGGDIECFVSLKPFVT